MEYSHVFDFRVLTAFPSNETSIESGKFLLSSGARVTLTGSFSLKPVFSPGDNILISFAGTSPVETTVCFVTVSPILPGLPEHDIVNDKRNIAQREMKYFG
jgi:hypothetical protein